jgi:LEA14-like dessication related protein
MCKIFSFLTAVWMSLFLTGCAGLQNSSFEPPVVSLHTFKVLPQEGITPRFEIGFRIINPNLDPLNLEGIFYTVDIEGHRILAGVSDNLPTVAPYGEANITLQATVDLIKGIQFISSLIKTPRDVFKYSFNAKLDPGGLTPKIIIREEGEFHLRNEM